MNRSQPRLTLSETSAPWPRSASSRRPARARARRRARRPGPPLPRRPRVCPRGSSRDDRIILVLTCSVMHEREEAGQYPFTRGLHPGGYRGKLWTMRQYAGFGTAAESNRRYRYLLERGTTGLSVAFDLPTQIGYDSDDPQAMGEVGRVGVAIDSLEDMEVLLDGIPLERVSTSMTINATAAILLALYVAVARRRGLAEDALSGTLQNDILKEYVARGTYIYPPGPSLRLVTDVIAYCARARAALEPDLDLGLPHPRGGSDGGPGDRLHPRARPRIRARRPRGRPRSRAVRRAALVLLRLPLRFPGGGGEVPGRPPPLGPPHEGDARRRQPEGPAPALPRPDGRRHPHRPAARQQRRARRPAGAGRRPRRLPEPPHQRQGRGARAPDRRRGPAGPAHPAGDRVRVGGREHRRSLRRVLRGGGGDRPPGSRSARAHRPHRVPRGRVARDRAGRDPARDPGVGLPLPAGGRDGRARHRGGEQVRGSRRGNACGHPPHRPRAGEGPDGARPSPARPPRGGSVACGPCDGRRACAHRRQPRAGHGGRGPGLGHGGRDRAPIARRVR